MIPIFVHGRAGFDARMRCVRWRIPILSRQTIVTESSMRMKSWGLSTDTTLAACCGRFVDVDSTLEVANRV